METDLCGELCSGEGMAVISAKLDARLERTPSENKEQMQGVSFSRRSHILIR